MYQQLLIIKYGILKWSVTRTIEKISFIEFENKLVKLNKSFQEWGEIS